ncbi:MAG TPA: YihY/virulence factor BrkB family protein [Ilumatobacteraceae bacterium]|nr:YihY/virulence factor BrkB family protein [Ilumatobacteraceae bacterium]HRB03825.1 YihY/virulence factor BrkB family protein [Ilumatobacteraceae bacterium]
MTIAADGEPRAGFVELNTVPATEVASTAVREADRGRQADDPTQVPPRGLRDVVARVRSEAKVDNVPLLSAGVAFYALLALVPAIVAIVSIYGLVADPKQVRAQMLDVLRTAPREVRELVATQLESIASSSSASTIVVVVLGVLAALWSASAGIGHLVDALNVAYDEAETRGAIRRRAMALLFTVGAILFVVVAVGVIGFLPALVARANLGAPGRIAIDVVRWTGLLAALLVGVAVLYRYGPDREAPKWRWTSPGALVAAALWLVGSLLFSLYTANFAKYNETYGSLGAVVVVMLWLFLTSLSVIIGAEVNAEMERQTVKDTTTGPPVRPGLRDAYAADTLGKTADAMNSDSSLPSSPAVLSHPVEIYPFRFSGLVGALARVFGVRSDRAIASISSDGLLSVRYGRWVATTPVANVRSVDVTGPYATMKVAGPPHLSFADRGLTFATNRDRGVCICFHEPVSALLPFGLLLHPGLTFTVDQPEQFAARLAQLQGQGLGN